MKYLIYWELNPEIGLAEVAKVAAELARKAEYPTPKGKILGWYITSSIPMWGITIVEYDKDSTSTDMFNSLLTWVKERPGIFKTYKVAPYVPVKDAVGLALKR